MRKLIITEWVSLDGIFDSGSMDKWWNPFDSKSRQQYIQDTINNSDAMLYGRKTYEMLYPYWSSFKDNAMGVADKLNKSKKYVVSSTLKKASWENTEILNEHFVEDVSALKKQDGSYILVQGSSTLIKPLMEAGLVDELRLLINPYLPGKGARPFLEEIKCGLELLQCERLENNVVLLRYSALKKS